MNRHPYSAATLGTEALFHTIIALVLHFMVIPDPDFWEIFFIAQVTGFSIKFSVQLGLYLVKRHPGSWPGAFIFLGFILGILVSGGINWAFLSGRHPIGATDFYKGTFLYILVFGGLFSVPILYFFYARDKLRRSQKRIQEEKLKRLTMEKESATTTLRLLQAQIEPHFLFNTLSNVLMLIPTDPDTAEEMLSDLNAYLRISLERTRQEGFTLSQELDLVRRYLNIFKIRLGERLEFDIDDRTGKPALPFPPLILQPLVENAVKYGIEPLVEGGKIQVICQKTNHKLHIRISDTGTGTDPVEGGAGIGLDNVNSRLASIYGHEAELTLKQSPHRGTTVILEVPL